MTLSEIILLAIIQGITEFLPISSSAHLILPSALFGWTDQGLGFDVAVHVGSLLAVMIYFREDIIRMLQAWLSHGFSQQQTDDSKLAWWVIIATVPAVIFGYTFKDFVQEYARSALVIACTTIGFGLLLWFADVKAKQVKILEKLGWKSALIIGFFQVLAIIPGTSRSGITMTAGLMMGLTRDATARFSFLLSIPTIAGAGLLATVDMVQTKEVVDWTSMLYGVVLSFVSAYLCISLFLAWISRIGMLPFVLYRLALGFILLAYIYL